MFYFPNPGYFYTNVGRVNIFASERRCFHKTNWKIQDLENLRLNLFRNGFGGCFKTIICFMYFFLIRYSLIGFKNEVKCKLYCTLSLGLFLPLRCCIIWYIRATYFRFSFDFLQALHVYGKQNIKSLNLFIIKYF